MIVEIPDIDAATSFDVETTPTDLIVVGFDMIGGLQLSGLHPLMHHFAGAVVVVSGGPARSDSAKAILSSGVSGYIPRTMTEQAFLSAISLILSGEKFIPDFAVIAQAEAMAPSSAPVLGTPIGSLSPRRRQILSMVARGDSNKVIALSLRINEVTVKSHLRAIYRTLGVTTRTQAAREAMFVGLTVSG